MGSQPVHFGELFMKYINDPENADISPLRSSIESLRPDVRYNVMEQQTNKYRWTIVHRATMENDVEVLKNVMETLTEKEKYKFIKLCDWDQEQTCLHMAAANGSEKATQFLLGLMRDEKPFALLAKQDKNERTCIHTAVLHNQLQMVKLFLSHSPREKVPQLLEMEDEDDKTALKLATENDLPEIVRCLREYKEDSKGYIADAIGDKDGDRELMIQQPNPTEGHREIAELKEKVDKQALKIQELGQAVNSMNKELIRCTEALFEKGNFLTNSESNLKEEVSETRRGEQPQQEDSFTTLPEIDEEGLRGTTPDTASASDITAQKENYKIPYCKITKD